VRAFVGGCALILGAAALSRSEAQVGYPPTRSPYRDVETTQAITLIGGYFAAHRDPANAAPQSGALVGAHYEWRASGPAHLTAELARIASDRLLIDPARSGPGRDLGTVQRPLYAADFGLGMALTGARSWNGFVPVVTGGVGFVSDFRTKPDSGGFKFGTRFAISWGAAIRWVPGGNLQVRADWNNRLYTIAYPESYYAAPTGGTAVVSTGQARSFWTNNPAFTLGISYLFSR
jgi:hypothetical protein